MESSILLQTTIAGILASIACGFGALPLSIKKIDFDKNIGLGFAFAGGLMISASVYNLIIPAVTFGLSQSRSKAVFLIITGILLGSLFIRLIEKYLTEDKLERRFIKKIGTRTEILLFIAMSFHSIPEGVAVGVGYAFGACLDSISNFGHYIAIAIAIHNVPEGLAVSRYHFGAMVQASENVFL